MSASLFPSRLPACESSSATRTLTSAPSDSPHARERAQRHARHGVRPRAQVPRRQAGASRLPSLVRALRPRPALADRTLHARRLQEENSRLQEENSRLRQQLDSSRSSVSSAGNPSISGPSSRTAFPPMISPAPGARPGSAGVFAGRDGERDFAQPAPHGSGANGRGGEREVEHPNKRMRTDDEDRRKGALHLPRLVVVVEASLADSVVPLLLQAQHRSLRLGTPRPPSLTLDRARPRPALPAVLPSSTPRLSLPQRPPSPPSPPPRAPSLEPRRPHSSSRHSPPRTTSPSR